MLSSALPLAVLALSSTSLVSAHLGCGGHQMAKRNTGMNLEWHAARMLKEMSEPRHNKRLDEASAAISTDVGTECTIYSDPTVVAALASYPSIWQKADILASDTTAAALFATINATLASKVPYIVPKGTNTGNFVGVNYTSADPDCWWTWRQCTTPKVSGIAADIITLPEPNSFGLGFDDGPNCSHNAFYDYLQTQKQTATMFYIGSNVMDWPYQAQRAVADGHEICVHTWSHLYMTSLTNSQAFAELYYAREAIKLVTGVTPKCWRPPYGDIDDRIRLIAAGLNLTSILWTYDSNDWRIGTGTPPVTQADVDANYTAVITAASNGSFNTAGTIMLTHELNNFTMSEFISFYPKLKAAFKYIVPVGAGLNWTTPYVETNYTYPDFAQLAGIADTATTSGAASATGSSASKTSGTAASASASKASSASSQVAGVAGSLLAGVVALFAVAF